MMLFQEQFMNKYKDKKLIKVSFMLAFDEGMTPNILTPQLCEKIKELGVVDATGNIANYYKADDEVNVVTVVRL